MNEDMKPPSFDQQAEAQRRRVMRAVKMLTVSWTLAIVLFLYFKYADKSASLTEIAVVVSAGCGLVGIWSIASFFHEWGVYRDQYGYLLDKAEDRE